jgi:hypothetical protein
MLSRSRSVRQGRVFVQLFMSNNTLLCQLGGNYNYVVSLKMPFVTRRKLLFCSPTSCLTKCSGEVSRARLIAGAAIH